MLADEKIVYAESTGTDALKVGEDNQLDETELKTVVEIPKDSTNLEAQTKAINEIPDEDQGEVNVSDDSKTSMWTYVMWVLGAILVLCLIGGCVYHFMQKKDEDFVPQDYPQVTEMEQETRTGSHQHHSRH